MKICILGRIEVGKTSILSRFCKNSFEGDKPRTVGGSYWQQNLAINGYTKTKLHRWDTMGWGIADVTKFLELYYRDANAIILVYDVTQEESFGDLDFWITQLNNKVKNAILCLAGNKNDVEEKEKKVPTSKGKAFAEKNNMIFYEISAKTCSGVKELFQEIANRFQKIRINA